MRHALWLFVLAGCGGSAPQKSDSTARAAFQKSQPAAVRAAKEGDRYLDGRVRLRKVDWERGAGIARAKLLIGNFTTAALGLRVRARWFDSRGERRTNASMRWEKLALGPGENVFLVEEFPDESVVSVGIEIQEEKNP